MDESLNFCLNLSSWLVCLIFDLVDNLLLQGNLVYRRSSVGAVGGGESSVVKG